MRRPLLKFGIAELEREFERRRQDRDWLPTLLEELEQRTTDRAARLRKRVEQELGVSQGSSSAPAVEPLPPSLPRPQASAPPPLTPEDFERAASSEISGHSAPPVPLTNAPESILDAWTVLEVLSPQSFLRPEALAGGDRGAVAWLDRGVLPWERGEKARPKTRLHYQVVLGTVKMEEAVGRLLSVYTDRRPERPAARGEAALAVVTLDHSGVPIDAPAALLSSFAWGLPRALKGNLGSLVGWRKAEKVIVEKLDEILRRAEDEGPLPIDAEALLTAYNWLVASLDLPSDLVVPPRLAIRSYTYYRNPSPPEPLLLNSFYLGDLAMVRSSFERGESTPNLRRYLGVQVPAQRHDLLRDTAVLESSVAPEKIPPARWPGPGRYPLVLLQQAAVNLAVQDLRDGGILAVNGPPGTGKTTLLRDLVAAILVQRAEAIASFDDPLKVFSYSNLKLRSGESWLHLYRVDDRVRGFEMLLASSNNKAVENVSAELPARTAVAGDAGLRYFATTASALLEGEREAWGLAAAVLGNAANRRRFRQTFWWDDDLGLSTYLAAAGGTPRVFERIDEQTKAIVERRPPRVVTEEDAPRHPEEALRRWKSARSSFREALEKCRKVLEELAGVREKVLALPSLAREEAEAAELLTAEKADEARRREERDRGRDRLAELRSELSQVEARLAEQDRLAPGFLARLFRTRRAREWRAARAPVLAARAQVQEALSGESRNLEAAEERLRQTGTRCQEAERKWAAIAARHAAVREEVEAVRKRIGKGLLDERFWELEHAERHTAVPWLDAAQQRVRDDVFVSAIRLHKAFVDAAAKPLRNNLGALMNLFGGGSLPAEKRLLLPDLWASLFLVVPLVSTTFASVERMLGDLPPESLGWLLVDEAGQALPQAAAGALLRTRRAVVLGDPVQIEPIVTLPDQLTEAVCRQFGVDPDRFNAPGASVQTLADAATPYFAEFPGRQGSRTVGVPLLVHRRCAEPMFGIANAIAYEHLMVNAKAGSESPIGSVLGPSCWIHVEGEAQEKWCPQEGEVVLSLLRRLVESGQTPDLYVVTPFLVVADRLRKLLRESGVLERWTEDPHSWVAERVGTVHTVQGREADAVIFVLGAPAPQQGGARGWAGGRPNLPNVAVTRAKGRLYVIGNRRLWKTAGLFRELDARLPG